MKWGIHWKYKLGIYVVLVCWAVYCLWLGVQIHTVEFERDALIDSVCTLQEKVDTLGTLALVANDQWIECLNTREEYINRYRSLALNCAEELAFFRPESTEVVNGILLERSKSAGKAYNSGVGIPFKAVGER